MVEVTNYIDRLVAELCPDGVEYRPLGEIADIGTGKSDKKDAQESGQYPFYVRSKTILRSSKYLYDETAIVIPGEGGVGEIFHFVSGKYDLHQRAYRVSFTVDEMNPKFGYYYISSFFKEYISRHAVEATVKSIRKPMLVKFEVPVPPMEIQEAIVEILDKFTNLEAELEAELEARTLQYEYYRDSLFEALDCPRVPLGSLGVRNKGIAITASKMRTLEPGNKDVRIFAAGSTFVDTDSSFIPDKGILEGPAIIVKSRGHIGFEYYEGKFTHKNELWSYSLTSDLVEQKFIYYYLLTQAYHLHELARGKSVKLPQLAVKDTDELLVPLPSLAEQQRIVDILDRFDALTSSLSEGLPAELAARRSQYEYYRDQLLTFPRKGENQ